jgi:hypothetical protein
LIGEHRCPKSIAKYMPDIANNSLSYTYRCLAKSLAKQRVLPKSISYQSASRINKTENPGLKTVGNAVVNTTLTAVDQNFVDTGCITFNSVNSKKPTFTPVSNQMIPSQQCLFEWDQRP